MRRLDSGHDGRGAGLCCPKCGHARWRVIYTRASGGRVRRRRECRACGYRVTTWERIIGHDDGVPTLPHAEAAPHSPDTD
jgi:hypothetical protein